MNRIQTTILAALLVAIGLSSCLKEPDVQGVSKIPVLPETSYDYISTNDDLDNLELPSFALVNSFFPDIEIDGSSFGNFGIGNNSKVESNEIATLGRVLFYDGKLSKNNTTACASCHQQKNAFADPVAFSTGFGGKTTTRNSMAIVNAGISNNFFWDSRQSSIENLVAEPITNHLEMGMEDVDALVAKLKDAGYYQELFVDAYGTEDITMDKVSDAVAQFMTSITTTQSTFDREIANNFDGYSELEKLGMSIFFSQQAQCSSCHSGVNFAASDGSFGEYQQSSGTANIGLDVDYTDQGKLEGQFKIPSLRNIALTGPYMHDGRFESLREVLDQYNKNIQPHLNLDDKLLNNGVPVKLNLNSLELDALEAFLHTLTDESLVNDPRYFNPFKI